MRKAETVQLAGRRCLLTGGAGTIGSETAGRLCAEGAQVVISDRDESRLAAVTEQLASAGYTVHSIGFDVCDDDEVRIAMAEAARTLGGLDTLVTNAGMIVTNPIADIAPAEFRGVLEVNLTGTFLCIRHAVPLIREAGGGAIVCMASQAGLEGHPEASSYCAAKFGVIGLVQSLGAELGPDRIRVNAVAPGDVESSMRSEAYARVAAASGQDPGEMTSQALEQLPLGRFARPEEVADAVVFLASDMASYISGATIPLLGGS